MIASKRSVVLSCIVLVVPILMGAKFTLEVTPNPNGVKSVLEGKGIVELAKGEKLVKITFETILKDSNPTQTSRVDGTVVGTKWSATLKLPSNKTFTPTKAVLHYTDADNKLRKTPVVVKTEQIIR